MEAAGVMRWGRLVRWWKKAAACNMPEHTEAQRRYAEVLLAAQQWEARARRAEGALEELRAEAAKWRNVAMGGHWTERING